LRCVVRHKDTLRSCGFDRMQFCCSWLLLLSPKTVVGHGQVEDQAPAARGLCCILGVYLVEGHPWVPVGHLWVPDFSVDIRGSPHKNSQPWVPATNFLFCVRGATRPNCQPLTLSHLESDRGPTASMPAAVRPHCILPARNLETLTIFLNFQPKQQCEVR
jgi:hypothetical protein